MPRRTTAIAIEGIGVTESATFSNGAAFCVGRTLPSGQGSYEWIQSLTELPDSIETTVDPLTGRYTISAFTFRLRRLDSIAKALLFQQTRTPNSLSANLTAAAPTLSITPTSGHTLTGTVIWIGDEAIRVGTDSGGTLTGLTRGFWGTQAKPHTSGDFIFEKQNSVRFRRVTLMTVDEANVITFRWQGFIDSVKTSENGTQILVGCKEGFATLAEMSLNRSAPELLRGSPDVFLVAPEPDVTTGDYDASPYASGSISIPSTLFGTSPSGVGNGRKSGVFKTVDVANEYTAIQIGQALTVAKVVGTTWTFDEYSTAYMGSAYELEEENRGVLRATASGPALSNNLLRIDADVYEVGIVSKAIDDALPTPVSFTRDMTYPYHPVTIAAVLLLSDFGDTGDTATYSVLEARNFAGNLRPLAASGVVAALDALILATQELEVDYFGPLGWDGEPFNLFDAVTGLLRLYGFMLTFNDVGEWSISQIKLVDVAEWDAAITNDVRVIKGEDEEPLIEWETAYDSTFSAISATVGRLPWLKPASIVVRVNGVSERAAIMGDREAATYDYNTVDRANAQDLAGVLANTGILLYFAMPRFSAWVEDSAIDSLDYTMGGVVSLQSPLALKRGGVAVAYLIGNDGEPTTAVDGVQFAGRLVGRLFDVATHRYRLRMLLTNYRLGAFIRWRAPSMVITAWTDLGGALYRLDCAASSSFGAAAGDSLEFNAGDDIEIFDRDGSRTAGAGIPGVWSLNAAPAATSLTTAGGPSVTVVGKIVRLAYYGTSGYVNTSIFTNIDRAYACFGDDSFDVLVDASGFNEQGDFYG